MEGTDATVRPINSIMDRGMTVIIQGRLPGVACFSGGTSGLLPFPIHFEVFSSEPTLRLSRLPAHV